MTSDEQPQFSHGEGCAVGGAAVLFGTAILFFAGEQFALSGMIAFGAIGATAWIQRRLLRRWWFVAFLAVMLIGHLALLYAFPISEELDSGVIKILGLADMLAVLALAFASEKLMSSRR